MRRVYGFIAAGAQVGQLCASLTAGTLFSFLQQRVVFLSALLIAACSYLVGLRGELWEPPSTSDSGGTAKQRANEEPVNGGGAMCGGRCGADTGLARGCCRSVQVLLSTPLLRAITLHTLLYTFLVSGIWYERAVSVSAAFHDDEGRYDFFATLNSLVSIAPPRRRALLTPQVAARAWAASAPPRARHRFLPTVALVAAQVGAFTLLVQVFCFSHLLRLLGPRGALVFEPIIVALGLGVNFVHPGLLSIALLDGGRKVLHYALLKPTKEGLYAALGSDAQFVAKPLLDTLVYRVGSLLGATYFTAAVKGGIGADARRTILLFVTLAWLGNSYYLGGLASQKDAGSADASDGRDGCKPAQAAQASEDPSPPAGRGGKGDQYSGVELSPADGDGDESAADGLASGDGEALRHARRPPPASPIRLALFLALAGSFLAFGVYASVAKALSGRHRHHAHAPPPAPLPTVAAVALAQSALPREAAPRQPPPLPSPLPLSPPPPPP